jgi:hypothetical protein
MCCTHWLWVWIGHFCKEVLRHCKLYACSALVAFVVPEAIGMSSRDEPTDLNYSPSAHFSLPENTEDINLDGDMLIEVPKPTTAMAASPAPNVLSDMNLISQLEKIRSAMHEEHPLSQLQLVHEQSQLQPQSQSPLQQQFQRPASPPKTAVFPSRGDVLDRSTAVIPGLQSNTPSLSPIILVDSPMTRKNSPASGDAQKSPIPATQAFATVPNSQLQNHTSNSNAITRILPMLHSSAASHPPLPAQSNHANLPIHYTKTPASPQTTTTSTTIPTTATATATATAVTLTTVDPRLAYRSSVLPTSTSNQHQGSLAGTMQTNTAQAAHPVQAKTTSIQPGISLYSHSQTASAAQPALALHPKPIPAPTTPIQAIPSPQPPNSMRSVTVLSLSLDEQHRKAFQEYLNEKVKSTAKMLLSQEGEEIVYYLKENILPVRMQADQKQATTWEKNIRSDYLIREEKLFVFVKDVSFFFFLEWSIVPKIYSMKIGRCRFKNTVWFFIEIWSLMRSMRPIVKC